MEVEAVDLLLLQVAITDLLRHLWVKWTQTVRRILSILAWLNYYRIVTPYWCMLGIIVRMIIQVIWWCKHLPPSRHCSMHPLLICRFEYDQDIIVLSMLIDMLSFRPNLVLHPQAVSCCHMPELTLMDWQLKRVCYFFIIMASSSILFYFAYKTLWAYCAFCTQLV